MTIIDDFPIGSRVRVTNYSVPYAEAFHDGQVGTVVGHDATYVLVDRDGQPAGGERWPYKAYEIERIAEPISPTTLRARADALNAEADAAQDDIQATLAEVEQKRKDIARKRTLAAQHRAVADDLESS